MGYEWLEFAFTRDEANPRKIRSLRSRFTRNPIQIAEDCYFYGNFRRKKLGQSKEGWQAFIMVTVLPSRPES